MVLLVIVGVFLILAVTRSQKLPKNSSSRVNIGNKATFTVEIADSEPERTQGYSNHSPISNQEGLLFVFSQKGNYPFWMKDMLFDLDFVIISDNRVVEIFENIPAPINNRNKIEYVYPTKLYDSLLEIKAGSVKKFGIKVEDRVEIID